VNTKVSDSCGMSKPNETRKHLNHARRQGFQSDFQTKPFRLTSETNTIFWILTGKNLNPGLCLEDVIFFFSNSTLPPDCMSDTLMSDTSIKEARAHHMVLARYSPLYEALTQKCSNQGGKKSLSRIAADYSSAW